jgi:hypothetical protein
VILEGSISCSWCHRLNPISQRWCLECRHRADVPRMFCDCSGCRAVGSARGFDPLNLADAIARGSLAQVSAYRRPWEIDFGIFGPLRRPLRAQPVHWHELPKFLRRRALELEK